MAMARIKPQAVRRSRRPAMSPAARQAMQLAALALTDAVPPLLGDEALAERERYRREDEARRSAQGLLPLGGCS